MFYFWNEITVRVKRGVWRFVKCEHCPTEYVYYAQRTATAFGHSPFMLDDKGATYRAECEANEHLRKRLLVEAHPVPCPVCGWYQNNMIGAYRKQFYGWMRQLGGFIAGFSPMMFIGTIAYFECVSKPHRDRDPSYPFYVAGGWAALFLVVGLTILKLRSVRQQQFDPNHEIDSEKRIAEGRRRAYTREEYEQLPYEDE